MQKILNCANVFNAWWVYANINYNAKVHTEPQYCWPLILAALDTWTVSKGLTLVSFSSLPSTLLVLGSIMNVSMKYFNNLHNTSWRATNRYCSWKIFQLPTSQTHHRCKDIIHISRRCKAMSVEHNGHLEMHALWNGLCCACVCGIDNNRMWFGHNFWNVCLLTAFRQWNWKIEHWVWSRNTYIDLWIN
jgi:hypothetical protein